LAEIGAKKGKELIIGSFEEVSWTYSERMIPELNISFAKIVP
jgi:hypothetical protein